MFQYPCPSFFISSHYKQRNEITRYLSSQRFLFTASCSSNVQHGGKHDRPCEGFIFSAQPQRCVSETATTCYFFKRYSPARNKNKSLDEAQCFIERLLIAQFVKIFHLCCGNGSSTAILTAFIALNGI